MFSAACTYITRHAPAPPGISPAAMQLVIDCGAVSRVIRDPTELLQAPGKISVHIATAGRVGGFQEARIRQQRSRVKRQDLWIQSKLQ